ncbi:MAG: DEAD/DEAH box helicase family protein, partial [Candidatus Humimicrobiaceae bacterium]
MVPGIDEKQINLFRSLFRGRSDVYAKRWQKGKKSGYMPAYRFNWNEYLSHKAQGGNFKNFSNKKKLPLTKEVMKEHLQGKHLVGIYPLLEDNTSYFVALDFDGKNWEKDSRQFIEESRAAGVPAYMEKSFSGEGAHLWVFFDGKYPAAKSRRIFLEIVRKALGLSEFAKEVSFDRIFPNQDYLSGKGFGNLIALPLNGRCVNAGRTVFVNPKDFKPILDQWGYLKGIKKVTISKLDQLYHELVEKGEDVSGIKNKTAGIMDITIGSRVILDKAQISKDLASFLKKNLNFINSEYIVKQKIGKSVYGIKKFFNLIKESRGKVMVPRGFLGELENYCNQNKIKYQIIDKRAKLAKTSFNSLIKLSKPQQKAIESCESNRSGVIVAPPGFGKTIIGIEIIAKKSQPALIIVHRRQILDQWLERIQDFLGMAKKDIGQISGRKKKISKHITVAMIQSLARYPALKSLGESFGTVIIDECHHIPAKSFRKTIVSFNPQYIYGLTATPKRKYNDEKMIFFYIGKIIYNNEGFSKQAHDSAISNIQLNIRDTSLFVPFNNKTDNFQMLSKILVFDTQRNKQVTEDIQNELGPGKKILVITERKEHVEILGMYLKSLCEVISITGDDSKSRRKLKMKQVKEGHFQVLITTGQLM